MITARRLIAFILVIIGFVVGWRMLSSSAVLFSRNQVVEDYKARRDRLKVEKEDLLRKYAYVQSQDFVEKESRERLNLQKEGEVVVVLPQNKDFDQVTASAASQVNRSNWGLWVNLFLY